MCRGTLPCFSTIFEKGNNFVDCLIASLFVLPLLNGAAVTGKNLLLNLKKKAKIKMAAELKRRGSI